MLPILKSCHQWRVTYLAFQSLALHQNQLLASEVAFLTSIEDVSYQQMCKLLYVQETGFVDFKKLVSILCFIYFSFMNLTTWFLLL